MAYLFKINNKVVFPNEETLLIYPFNEIWNRDNSKDKYKAIQEFTYIEFKSSMLKSNPYREYTEERKDMILKKEIMLDENYEPDDLIIEAFKKIEEFQTQGSITYTYWMSNKQAIEKMISFFNNFDINERNERSGTPIYKPKDITSAIADAEKTLMTLTALKSKVEEELYQKNKTRSDKVISQFANPESLNR